MIRVSGVVFEMELLFCLMVTAEAQASEDGVLDVTLGSWNKQTILLSMIKMMLKNIMRRPIFLGHLRNPF